MTTMNLTLLIEHVDIATKKVTHDAVVPATVEVTATSTSPKAELVYEVDVADQPDVGTYICVDFKDGANE